MAQPVKIFYCYASDDEDDLNNLRQQLKLLERKGLIETWYDRQILPGADAAQESEIRLSQAQIIIVLISPAFLASEYYDSKEMEIALQLHRDGKARVVPVLLDPCFWDLTPLKDLQPLPDNRKPISKWLKKPAAWFNVASGIHALVQEMLKQVEQEPEIKTTTAKTRNRRTRSAQKNIPRSGPISGAMVPAISAKRTRKPLATQVIESPFAYRERETALKEEPEPKTPEAKKATLEYNQDCDNLQDKIMAVSLKILVWEPDSPTEGIVAEERRHIFQALEAEKHECQLGRSLSVPSNASRQDSEIEQARQSDTTILLVEPPAIVEMTEFCKHEEVVEKTLVFYPDELKSHSEHWTLEKKLRIRFHLQYYGEQDIMLDHVLSTVLDWVMAQRSFRYSNIA